MANFEGERKLNSTIRSAGRTLRSQFSRGAAVSPALLALALVACTGEIQATPQPTATPTPTEIITPPFPSPTAILAEAQPTPSLAQIAMQKAAPCVEEATTGKNATVTPRPDFISVLELQNPANPAEGGTYSLITVPGELRSKPAVDFQPTDGTMQLATSVTLRRGATVSEVITSIRDPRASKMQLGTYTEAIDPDNCNISTISWEKGRLGDIKINGVSPRDLRRSEVISP